jgi:hypothetical protein
MTTIDMTVAYALPGRVVPTAWIAPSARRCS